MVGITVTLTVKTQTGTDAFGEPIYSTADVDVANVLVSPTTADDIINSVDLYGKKAVYTLGIPKGNTHNWTDTEVKFFGHTFRTFGPVIEGIEANVPTEWHKKVMVERYE